MKCLIIIPAYNEAENIAATVDELLAKTRSFPMELDYLVVNDGSSDNTEAVLREHGFHFITLPVNLGIGGAVQSGYLYAQKNNFDIAVQMDGDGHSGCSIPADSLRDIIAWICGLRQAGSRYFRRRWNEEEDLSADCGNTVLCRSVYARHGRL